MEKDYKEYIAEEKDKFAIYENIEYCINLLAIQDRIIAIMEHLSLKNYGYVEDILNDLKIEVEVLEGTKLYNNCSRDVHVLYHNLYDKNYNSLANNLFTFQKDIHLYVIDELQKIYKEE